ncbi:MAG: 4Fe-4S dicluster domain-containing protein [Lentimicrobiaceae bacterium]|nr:4Fe-4S dicluster domain-containing protein [Lentimicrobiaceae bacterium]
MKIDFGYKINSDQQIDYDANDKRIHEYLLKEEPSFRSCMFCGCCTATCSTGTFTQFNFRKLHTLIRRGETASLKNEIEKCMFCGKCLLVCPAGVNTRNLIFCIHKAIENFQL